MWPAFCVQYLQIGRLLTRALVDQPLARRALLVPLGRSLANGLLQDRSSLDNRRAAAAITFDHDWLAWRLGRRARRWSAARRRSSCLGEQCDANWQDHWHLHPPLPEKPNDAAIIIPVAAADNLRALEPVREQA
jgi:hypothetical protein